MALWQGMIPICQKLAEATSWNTPGKSLLWDEIHAYVLEIARSLGMRLEALSSNLLYGLVGEIFNDAHQRHLDGDAPELSDYTAQIVARLRRNDSSNAQLTPPAMSRPYGSPGAQGTGGFAGGGAPPSPPPVPAGTPQEVERRRARQA